MMGLYFPLAGAWLMTVFQNFCLLSGRFLLGLYFIVPGIGKITNFDGTSASWSSPMPLPLQSGGTLGLILAIISAVSLMVRALSAESGCPAGIPVGWPSNKMLGLEKRWGVDKPPAITVR